MDRVLALEHFLLGLARIKDSSCFIDIKNYFIYYLIWSKPKISVVIWKSQIKTTVSLAYKPDSKLIQSNIL
jgi:hypothetical protein